MKLPRVTSVILNTNRRDDTLACLESLRQSDYPNQAVIVLDNASSDGSVEAIHMRYPEVQIISLTDNRGYAGNNNAGIQAAIEQGADWVFVLNEDTFLAADAITRLVEIGQNNPDIGMLGPLVYHHNEPDIIQTAGGILDHHWLSSHAGQNEPDQGQYFAPRQVDWISGCAIFVRREVIEQVGMIDERFFYYWEETEWCVRARRGGWSLWVVPTAKLWHKGVQRDYQPGPNVTYYWTRNWLMLLHKHHAPWSAWIFALGWTLRNLLSWSLRPKWRDKRPHRDAMLQGLLDFFRKRWGMRPS